MGSFIEINDTLQVSLEQWFPKILDIETHKGKTFKVEYFKDKTFDFKDKKWIRIYKIPPVRNFLVQNLDWKWIYWWLCHIIEVKHDYVNNITSWRFNVTYINTYDEMKKAHDLIDRNIETNFFN